MAKQQLPILPFNKVKKLVRYNADQLFKDFLPQRSQLFNTYIGIVNNSSELFAFAITPDVIIDTLYETLDSEKLKKYYKHIKVFLLPVELDEYTTYQELIDYLASKKQDIYFGDFDGYAKQNNFDELVRNNKNLLLTNKDKKRLLVNNKPNDKLQNTDLVNNLKDAKTIAKSIHEYQKSTNNILLNSVKTQSSTANNVNNINDSKIKIIHIIKTLPEKEQIKTIQKELFNQKNTKYDSFMIEYILSNRALKRKRQQARLKTELKSDNSNTAVTTEVQSKQEIEENVNNDDMKQNEEEQHQPIIHNDVNVLLNNTVQYFKEDAVKNIFVNGLKLNDTQFNFNKLIINDKNVTIEIACDDNAENIIQDFISQQQDITPIINTMLIKQMPDMHFNIKLINKANIDNSTNNLWNNSLSDDDINPVNDEQFNEVLQDNVKLSQVQEKLNAQLNKHFNSSNIELAIANKTDKLEFIINIINSDKELAKQVKSYVKQHKKDWTNNELSFIKVQSWPDVILQRHNDNDNIEFVARVNNVLKQQLALFKTDWKLEYQYKLLISQFDKYNATVRLITDRRVSRNVVQNIIKAIKELYHGNINIRVSKHNNKLDNFIDEEITIPKSKYASLMNREDQELILGSTFSIDNTTVTNLDHVDFTEKLNEGRDDDKKYMLTFIEPEDDGATSFMSKKGVKWDKMKFLAIDDNNNPVLVSLFGQWKDEDKTIKRLNKLQKGDLIAGVGRFGYSDFDKTNLLNLNSLKIIKPASVDDNTKVNNRYELHAHTKMSQLAALNEPNELINKAVNNGFGGIAFTDDVSVQSYPKLIAAQNKFKEFKPLFGTELNVITNKPVFVYNANDIKFVDPNTTYVAFDIETTGFTVRYDNIIELSAVKYKPVYVEAKGRSQAHYELKEVDHIYQLVHNKKLLDAAITKLTKITQIDLDNNGIDIKDALQRFIDFINEQPNTILIGHNVQFDIGFINYQLKENGFDQQISHEVLDTLTIARRYVPNSRAYNLSALTKKLKVKLTKAHTAVFDAQATGFVWMALFNLINENNDIQNGLNLQKHELNNEHAYQEGFSYTISALAKNQKGIKEIYRLISIASTQHFYREAKVYPFELQQNHENILLGSGGYNSLFWRYAYEKKISQAKEIAQKMQYDYIEIAPFKAYALPDNQYKQYQDTVQLIIKMAKELQIPVVAISDTHYASNNKYDKMAYEVLVSRKKIPDRLLPETPFYNTHDMLHQFAFLGEKVATDIVINNTVKIANQCSNDIHPIVTDVTPPIIPGADDDLRNETMQNAEKMYGKPLNPEIKERLETELNFIIKGGYAVHYITAQKVVKKSESMGYLVGSRGSVGSSAVAFMMGITEVNALRPHYRSKYGDYFEWGDQKKYPDGFDLPPKKDPNHPGEWLIRDGHNIPFSTFLGLRGTKVPDIDLNSSAEIQPKLQLYLKDVFGEDHTIRVGTIGTIAGKNAIAFVKDYIESRQAVLTDAEQKLLESKVRDVKKNTGQHPAGIMIVPRNKDILDFTPYNYPANRPGPWKTTHYIAKDMHDALLKMDVLGHDDPSVLHMLQQLTGVNPHKINVTDPGIMKLFETEDVAGIPEFNTNFAKGVLKIAKPHTFGDLVQISGLSHGTNVWEGNAKELIEHDGKTLKDVIGSRDKIVTDLLAHNLDIEIADGISKVVKKGKPLKPDVVKAMQSHGVPQWYIDSLKKISYLYPAAHAVAYVMSALRIAYFKVYHPIAFYAAIMTYRYSAFDIDAMCSNDINLIKRRIKYYNEKYEDYDRRESSDLKKAASLEVACEAIERGVTFDKPNLQLSQVSTWILHPDQEHYKGHVIVPLEAIDGFGLGAAENTINYRESHNGQLATDMKVVKDKKEGMGLNKSVLTVLENMRLISISEKEVPQYTKTGKLSKRPKIVQTVKYL